MLASTARRADATGNGTASNFPFLFKIFENADIKVKVFRTSTGVETTLTVLTDYTVALTGPAPSVGSITLVNSGQAWLTVDGYLASGYTIAIIGNREYSQPVTIRNQSSFNPEVIEGAWDKLLVLVQQLKEKLDRAILLRETSTATSPILDGDALADSDDEIMKVNSEGTGIEPSGVTFASFNADVAAAAASAAEAASSESAAAASATAAASSATSAASSASSASTSASAASTSASSASTSATAAASSATAAASSETNAASSASTASTQATNAATSATSAASSATTATTQATNAATSASAASTSASSASTSATSAATSATNAASSATSAASSATAAAASATLAAANAGYGVTGTFASPTGIAGSGAVAFTADTQRSKLYVQGSGGAQTVGSFQAGTVDGQEILLVGCSDTNTLTIDSPTRCITKGTLILGANDMAAFCWDHGSTKWVEVSRNN